MTDQFEPFGGATEPTVEQQEKGITPAGLALAAKRAKRIGVPSTAAEVHNFQSTVLRYGVLGALISMYQVTRNQAQDPRMGQVLAHAFHEILDVTALIASEELAYFGMEYETYQKVERQAQALAEGAKGYDA